MNRRITNVASAAILVLEILVGHSWTLHIFPMLHRTSDPSATQLMSLYIVGVWKFLAVGALLWPRLPRLREWAYAGVFFEMWGAAASHVLIGDPIGKYAAPLAFTFLTLVSRWLQSEQETPCIRHEAADPFGRIGRLPREERRLHRHRDVL